nr:uncharacterized protein LOC113827108 [Penaeus vannamei]
MKALSLCLLVAVAGSCAGQSIQQLLDHVGINNPTATEEIRAIFTRSNQHNVLSCLVNNVPVDGGRPCDARTATFRTILLRLDTTNYDCQCPSQSQVDAFINLIRRNFDRANCNALKSQLQLRNLRC